MRVVQSRCMKCGTVFAAPRKRVSYCTCCFADETYLKPVEADAGAGTDARVQAGVRAGAVVNRDSCS